MNLNPPTINLERMDIEEYDKLIKKYKKLIKKMEKCLSMTERLSGYYSGYNACQKEWMKVENMDEEEKLCWAEAQMLKLLT